MFLRNDSRCPLGLDISELSLKMIQLKKTGDRLRVQAIGKKDLPEGCFSDGLVKDREKVVNALKELVSKPKFGKFSSREVVACLPEGKTFIKLIEVEKTPNDLSNILEGEMEKHIPLPLAEIYYDWQIIKNLPDKYLILIGAAPKKIVDQYIEVIQAAKLSVAALEIEPAAICRALLAEENPRQKDGFDKNYALIDIGATRTSLALYSHNTILFTVSMPISGNKITETIAKELEIEREQAEKAKIICGLDQDRAQGIIKNILSQTIDELAGKINHTLDYYQHHFSGRGAINKIIICGGGANIKNLDKILENKLGIKVEKGDVLINLREKNKKTIDAFSEQHVLEANLLEPEKKESGKSQGLSIIQNNSLTYATAVGLALRGFFTEQQ